MDMKQSHSIRLCGAYNSRSSGATWCGPRTYYAPLYLCEMHDVV